MSETNAVIPVPSLSAAGWVTEVGEKCDLLMAYFFESDYSMSNEYLGSVASLAKIIQDHGHEPHRLRSVTEDTLLRMMGSYFEDVSVSVRVAPVSTDQPNTFNIEVDVMVVQEGKRYNLGRVLEVRNSKLKKVTNLQINK